MEEDRGNPGRLQSFTDVDVQGPQISISSACPNQSVEEVDHLYFLTHSGDINYNVIKKYIYSINFHHS